MRERGIDKTTVLKTLTTGTVVWIDWSRRGQGYEASVRGMSGEKFFDTGVAVYVDELVVLSVGPWREAV
jgi:hypothetical protein